MELAPAFFVHWEASVRTLCVRPATPFGTMDRQGRGLIDMRFHIYSRLWCSRVTRSRVSVIILLMVLTNCLGYLGTLTSETVRLLLEYFSR